jgi:hypothetical protein
MDILNNKPENKSILYRGIGLIRTINCINPTAEEYNEIFEDQVDDIKYFGTNKDGFRWVRLDFYLDVSGIELPIKRSFFITELPETSKTGKTCYINQIMDTSWVEDESLLAANFTKAIKDKKELFDYTYREGFKGEGSFIPFVKAILANEFKANTNKFNQEFKVKIDYDTLFEGDFTKFSNFFKNYQFTPFYAYFYPEERTSYEEQAIKTFEFDQWNRHIEQIYEKLNEIYEEDEDEDEVSKGKTAVSIIASYKDLKFTRLLKKLVDDRGELNIEFDPYNQLVYGKLAPSKAVEWTENLINEDDATF